MLTAVEATVILYPALGGTYGSLQDTFMVVRVICSANKSVGEAPIYYSHY